MTAKNINSPGLWEVSLLSLLCEGPMHPYEMQRLLRERHKDELLVLKRGSLYHAINRLVGAKLIDAVETGREGRRPERTTYQITTAGQQSLNEWLRQMVAVPQREPSAFMAAISFLVYLKPKDAISMLEERAQGLENEIAALNTSIGSLRPLVGRINLIEIEYTLAMRRAEANWIRGFLSELRSGELTWDLKKIIKAIRAAKVLRQSQKER